MGVVRPEMPWEHFTPLRNCWLRDERISYKAKGILGNLMSHAPGFRVSQNLLVRQGKDGRDSVLSGLAELEGAGYLRRDRQPREGGQYVEDDYVLCDPFDSRGTLAVSGGPTDSGPNRSGGPTGSDSPSRSTRDGSPEHKKTRGEDEGTPPESRASQLRLVEQAAETPADRQKALGSLAALVTREHVEAMGGLGNYLALLGVIKRTLDVPREGTASAAKNGTPPRYTPERVRGALASLREAGRPVTLQTMHSTLEGDAQRRPRPGASAPYRDPDPAAYEGGF